MPTGIKKYKFHVFSSILNNVTFSKLNCMSTIVTKNNISYFILITVS
jgi:hypothetical protein